MHIMCLPLFIQGLFLWYGTIVCDYLRISEETLKDMDKTSLYQNMIKCKSCSQHNFSPSSKQPEHRKLAHEL